MAVRVPATFPISLTQIIAAVKDHTPATTNDLNSCITNAISGYFDPVSVATYPARSMNRFLNYGPPSGVLPTVSTSSIYDIAYTIAYGGGNVTSEGSSSVTERGIVWNTTANPTITSYIGIQSSGSGLGIFTGLNMRYLTAGTTYHVRAYATNSTGTSYGADLSFNTLSISVPVVVTSTNITKTFTTMWAYGSQVTSDGGASITQAGVCISTSQDPTLNDLHTVDSFSVGSFDSYLTQLTPGTVYYIRAYAINSVGTAYGSNVSFTTISTAFGTPYQGGEIFYILGYGDPGYDPNVIHGLVTTTVDVGSYYWGDNKNISGTQAGLGTGLANTYAIVGDPSYYTTAADRAYQTYSGGYVGQWYLPSIDELQLLYDSGVVSSSQSLYWSSTQDSSTQAYAWNFGIGTSNSMVKTYDLVVRPIHAF